MSEVMSISHDNHNFFREDSEKQVAGLYARVSTKDKGQDPHTQIIHLRTEAERLGYDVIEYVEFGSGRSTDGRGDDEIIVTAPDKDSAEEFAEFTVWGDELRFFGGTVEYEAEQIDDEEYENKEEVDE